MRRPVVLALVWFFLLGGLGAWFPFVSLYLTENAGLTGSQAGLVLSLLPAVGIAAQPFWGQVADRTGSRTRVLAVLTLCAACGYIAFGTARGFGAIALAMAALAFFASALIPTSVAVTLALVRDAGHRAFGLMRVWGTVGFLVFVVGFPYLLHAYQRHAGLARVPGGPSEPGLEIMFPLTGMIVALGGLVAFALPREGAVALRAPRGDWRRLFRHGPYVRLLVFAILAYACLQGPQVFFPVFIRSQGGDVDTVSRMWILMLLLEIPLVAYSGDTLKRLGPRGLLAIGVLAGGLRWAVCGFAPDLRWVYPVQLLHGVVVAGLVIGAPLYADAVVPERLRSTGQGVLAMLGISLGGILSNLATGWLVEHVSPSAPFALGGAGALVLGLCLPWLLPEARRAPVADDEGG